MVKPDASLDPNLGSSGGFMSITNERLKIEVSMKQN